MHPPPDVAGCCRSHFLPFAVWVSFTWGLWTSAIWISSSCPGLSLSENWRSKCVHNQNFYDFFHVFWTSMTCPKFSKKFKTFSMRPQLRAFIMVAAICFTPVFIGAGQSNASKNVSKISSLSSKRVLGILKEFGIGFERLECHCRSGIGTGRDCEQSPSGHVWLFLLFKPVLSFAYGILLFLMLIRLSLVSLTMACLKKNVAEMKLPLPYVVRFESEFG